MDIVGRHSPSDELLEEKGLTDKQLIFQNPPVDTKWLDIFGELEAIPTDPKTCARKQNSKHSMCRLVFFVLFFWLLWVFVAAYGLSLVAASRGYSSWWCAGFSLRWLLLLRSMGSRRTGFSSCGLRALERRLSSCGAWA